MSLTEAEYMYVQFNTTVGKQHIRLNLKQGTQLHGHIAKVCIVPEIE